MRSEVHTHTLAALSALDHANVPTAQTHLEKILRLTLPESYDVHLGKILLSPEQIYSRVADLGLRISRAHPEGVHLVGILEAGRRFTTDLVKHISPPPSVEFIYSSGSPSTSPKPIILCDTIHDSGATLSRIKHRISTPVETCVLVEKVFDRPRPDYIGALCPKDLFVVGYGLDHNSAFRNLSYILEYKNPQEGLSG